MNWTTYKMKIALIMFRCSSKLREPEPFAEEKGFDLDPATKVIVAYAGGYFIEWQGGDHYRMDLYEREYYTPDTSREEMERLLCEEWVACGCPD